MSIRCERCGGDVERRLRWQGALCDKCRGEIFEELKKFQEERRCIVCGDLLPRVVVDPSYQICYGLRTDYRTFFNYMSVEEHKALSKLGACVGHTVK